MFDWPYLWLFIKSFKIWYICFKGMVGFYKKNCLKSYIQFSTRVTFSYDKTNFPIFDKTIYFSIVIFVSANNRTKMFSLAKVIEFSIFPMVHK